VEKYQGAAIKQHKEENLPFYSAWKALGIGFLCCIFFLSVILGIVFLQPADFDVNTYNQGTNKFSQNEQNALDLSDTMADFDAVFRTDSIIIPLWKNNVEIIEKLNKIENLPDELIRQNRLLVEYSKLRIKEAELYKNQFLYPSGSIDEEIASVHYHIASILDELKE
jgi:hypothetical protein